MSGFPTASDLNPRVSHAYREPAAVPVCAMALRLYHITEARPGRGEAMVDESGEPTRYSGKYDEPDATDTRPAGHKVRRRLYRHLPRQALLASMRAGADIQAAENKIMVRSQLLDRLKNTLKRHNTGCELGANYLSQMMARKSPFSNSWC